MRLLRDVGVGVRTMEGGKVCARALCAPKAFAWSWNQAPKGGYFKSRYIVFFIPVSGKTLLVAPSKQRTLNFSVCLYLINVQWVSGYLK